MTDSVQDKRITPAYEPPSREPDADTQAEIERTVANPNPAEGLELLRTRPDLAPRIADTALRGGNFTLAYAAQTTPPAGESGDRIVPGSVTGTAIGLGYEPRSGSPAVGASAPASASVPATPDVVARLPRVSDGTKPALTGNQVLVPNSTTVARADFARQIAQTPGHPLNFLVNPTSATPQLWRKNDIPFFRGEQPLNGEFYRDMGPGFRNIALAEHPYLTQMAHTESNFALQTPKDSQIVVDTAHNNQVQGRYGESKGVIYTQGSTVAIDGVPASNAAIEEWKQSPISPEIADQLKNNVRPDGTPYRAGETLLREGDLAGRNVTSINLGRTPQETANLNKPAGAVDAPSTGTGAPAASTPPGRVAAAVDTVVQPIRNAVQPLSNAVQPLRNAANAVLSPIERASQSAVNTVRQVAQPAVNTVMQAAQPAIDSVRRTAAPVMEAVEPVISRAKPVLNALGRVASRVALPVGVALDAINIATAEDKPRAIAGVAGGWTGAAAGAAMGSALGPVGTLVGGVAGYIVGSGLGQAAYDGAKNLLNSIFG